MRENQSNLTLTQKLGSAIAVIGGSLFGLEAKADEVPEPKFIKGGYYAKDLPVYHSEGYPGHDYTGECKETVEKMQKSVEKPVWSRVNGPLVHRVGLHDGKIAHRQWITLNSDRYPIEVWTEKDGQLVNVTSYVRDLDNHVVRESWDDKQVDGSPGADGKVDSSLQIVLDDKKRRIMEIYMDVNGQPTRIVNIERTFDGKLRQVLVDENGDGSFDVRISDSDNDGKLDKEEKIGGYVKRKTD